jgi:hypothetical protein
MNDPGKIVIRSWAALWAAFGLYALILTLVDPARGAWGPAGRPTVSGASFVQVQPTLPSGWFWSATYPGWAFETTTGTYSGGQIVRWWNPHTNQVIRHVPAQPVITNPVVTRPTPAVREDRHTGPILDTTPAPAVPNFGVDLPAIAATEVGYTSRGHPISREEAVRAVEADPLDDSKRPRVTVFADEALAAQIEKDINTDPRLARLKAAATLESYRPTDWYFKDAGIDRLPQYKGVCIVFSRPDTAGQKVDHVQWEYKGPADLAAAADQWNPAASPDLRPQPAPPGLDFEGTLAWLKNNQTLVLVVLAGFGYWYLNRKRM